MSENLRECLKELQKAMKVKNKFKREIILEFLSQKKCIYNAMREIAMNIFNEQIKLKNEHIRRLKPHVKTIKALKRGVKTKRNKQKLVIQSGGFLPWLIPIVTSALPSLINLIK